MGVALTTTANRTSLATDFSAARCDRTERHRSRRDADLITRNNEKC